MVVMAIHESATAGAFSGGIIIPDSAKEKPQEAKVIALGTGKRDDDGNHGANQDEAPPRSSGIPADIAHPIRLLAYGPPDPQEPHFSTSETRKRRPSD